MRPQGGAIGVSEFFIFFLTKSKQVKFPCSIVCIFELTLSSVKCERFLSWFHQWNHQWNQGIGRYQSLFGIGIIDVNAKAWCYSSCFLMQVVLSTPFRLLSFCLSLHTCSLEVPGGAYFPSDFSTLLPKVINLTLNCPYEAEIRERD